MAKQPRLVASLTAALVAFAGVLALPSVVGAQQAFGCDPGFYQIIDGQFAEFDAGTDVYTDLGTKGSDFDAMGYRLSDDLVYAVADDKLIKVDANGARYEVGTLSIPTGSTSADFGDDGLLYVNNEGSDWYKIDVDTLVATPVAGFNNASGVFDIVNIYGTFYGMDSSGGLWLYNQSSATASYGGAVADLTASGRFPDAWTDAGGNLYIARRTGHLFQITGFSTGSPTATHIANTNAPKVSDGASCPYAPPPPGTVDVDGPTPETTPSTPEAQAAATYYENLVSTDPSYQTEDAGLGEGASCEPTTIEDRLPPSPISGLVVSTPTTLINTGFDAGFADYQVLTGSWLIENGALKQLNDCGYDYTALLISQAVEHFSYETTFTPLAAGINQGGIVINQSSVDTRSGAMLIDLTDNGSTLRWGNYSLTGHYQAVGSVAVDGTASATIKAVVHSGNVEIFFNGTSVATTTSTNTAGYVGLSATLAGIAFDSAVLTALPAAS